jgi:serine/threonine protein kinase
MLPRPSMEVAAKVEQFGKYTILGRIASGGMASVFLGRERVEGGPDRWVAVKRVHPHLVQRKDVVQMFLNEAKLLSRLDHKNISGIVDFGIEGDSPYIVMRYLHGIALSGLIRKLLDNHEPLPIDMMAYVAASISDGLHYAHEAHGENGEPLGLVHRDISPQNIFITFEGGVMLLDFGVAKAAGFTGFTRTGHIKGKYAYMSPEQVAASALDRRSDVFSLGIVLWESLTGRHLFRRKQHIETLRAIARADVPPVSEYNVHVPPMLEAIVARALVADRRLRYQTAKAMGAELWSYLQQQDERITPEHTARIMRATYPETKHPAELDGNEDTRRLSIAVEQEEEAARDEADGDPNEPLDDLDVPSIPEIAMAVGAFDDAQPIQTQPDGVVSDSLRGTLAPEESGTNDAGFFGDKTVAMTNLAEDRHPLESVEPTKSIATAELTPADTLAAPTLSVLKNSVGADLGEAVIDPTLPVRMEEPTRKAEIEFEDGTEVQSLAPLSHRATEATLRDTPLDPSEREAIQRATRRTLVDSPLDALRKAYEATADPRIVDPNERDTAFRPNPLSISTRTPPRDPDRSHGPFGSDAIPSDPEPTAGPTPPIAPKPKRSAPARRPVWPEVLLVVVAAVSIGALVYALVFRYVSDRRVNVVVTSHLPATETSTRSAE